MFYFFRSRLASLLASAMVSLFSIALQNAIDDEVSSPSIFIHLPTKGISLASPRVRFKSRLGKEESKIPIENQ